MYLLSPGTVMIVPGFFRSGSLLFERVLARRRGRLVVDGSGERRPLESAACSPNELIAGDMEILVGL
jgi:hypothetical protein